MIKHGFYAVLFNNPELPSEMKNLRDQQLLIDMIDARLTISNYKRNQLLLVPGQVADHLYFLESGAARAYFQDADNKEHTLFFWDEKSIVTDSVSFFSNRQSQLYIEIMQDSVLLSLSRSNLEDILIEFPYMRLLLNSILLTDFTHCRSRVMDFISLNATERYQRLTKAIPRVELRFQQQEIASYLGTSRQTISRSKKLRYPGYQH